MSARLCPICKVGNLGPHCKDSATCSWHRCPACSATLDLAAHRGYDKGYSPIVWPNVP